jgi:GT2 family glycosyltransferase
MIETPLISILIVTWNRKDDVLETLQSVYQQAYQNFEIVVVDNGSEDGTVDALRSLHPNVLVVALERNIGISAGRNAGIEIAHGEIIFCLDSDASLANNALTNIVRRFQADESIGVINSKIVNAYTKELDGGPGWAYSEEQKANQNMEFLSWSFSEGGAAIRKEVLDQVGNFWEVLFFGCEGQELSLRVWDAGYKVLYYPESLVYHRASPQQRVAGKDRDALFFKNNLFIYIARYPFWLLMLIAPLKIGATTLRAVRRGYLMDVSKSLLAVVKALPLLLKHRKPIKNRTATLYLKLQREQGPLSWGLFTWLRHKA